MTDWVERDSTFPTYNTYWLTNVNDAQYANGTWVAVGSYGCVATSPDGLTWTLRRSTSTSGASTLTFSSLTYGNGAWVATVYDASAGTGYKYNLWRSTDNGATWSATLSPGLWAVSNVTFSNGTFVALATVSTGGGPPLYEKSLTSTDGSTWTQHTHTYGLNTVAPTPTGFVGFDQFESCYTSTDGITWDGPNLIAVDVDITNPDVYWRNYGLGASPNGLVCIGYNWLYYLTGDDDITETVYTSPDGVTWSAGTQITSGPRLSASIAGKERALIRYGNSKYKVYGNDGVWTGSPDALTWSRYPLLVPLPSGYGQGNPDVRWNNVAYGNGRWVLGGEWSQLWTLEDPEAYPFKILTDALAGTWHEIGKTPGRLKLRAGPHWFTEYRPGDTPGAETHMLKVKTETGWVDVIQMTQ